MWGNVGYRLFYINKNSVFLINSIIPRILCILRSSIRIMQYFLRLKFSFHQTQTFSCIYNCFKQVQKQLNYQPQLEAF
jgi:hypothetical protein